MQFCPSLSHTKAINIKLPTSKSILCRVMIIESVLRKGIVLNYKAEANDVFVLKRALDSPLKEQNIEDSGTPYRFLMAFYAAMGRNKILHCTKGLKKRPIADLAKVLIENKTKISYLEKDKFPPIEIDGKLELPENISMDPRLSSQFISAIMLIAPTQNKDITIVLLHPPSSLPYIQLTADVMQHYGIECKVNEKRIEIKKGKYEKPLMPYFLEADWTSASYFYAIALIKKQSLQFKKLSLQSPQGDVQLAKIFEHFGIESKYLDGNVVEIKYNPKIVSSIKTIDLKHNPDIAPTLIVLSAIQKMDITFIGLENLKIKESNRIKALHTELRKINVELEECNGKWRVDTSKINLKEFTIFDSHKDHRIAMSLALLSCVMEIKMNEPEVVSKSFPYFWIELAKLNKEIE